MPDTIDLTRLKPLELDALREIANMGAGHAATALSKLLGGRVMIKVPRISITRLEDATPDIAEAEELVAAVLMHVMGDLTGRTVLVFPFETAEAIAKRLSPDADPATDATFLSEMQESAIKEVG